MDFLEKNLEDIIFESDPLALSEKGLEFLDDRSKLLRQVNLGLYGICDLIEYKIHRDKRIPSTLPFKIYKYNVLIHVIELKQGIIDMDAIMQLNRYKTAIKRIIENYIDNTEDEICYKIKGICIGNKIQEGGGFTLVYNFLDDDIYTYSYELDGISFNKESKAWYTRNDDQLLDDSYKKILDINNYNQLKESSKQLIHDISEPVLKYYEDEI